jgi:hypothetical protein
LQDNAHKTAENSALAIAGVKIAMPDPYSGSPVLETFEVFVAKVVDWLELHNLLRPGYEQDQVLLMGQCLEGEAATWYYDNVRCPTRINSIRWELETVVHRLQQRFIPTLSHHRTVSLFYSVVQGTKTVQELMNCMTKYADRMVSLPDTYTFRRMFLNALNPLVRTAVLKAGCTPEFSEIKKIFAEAKKYDNAIRFDTGMSRQTTGAATRSRDYLLADLPKDQASDSDPLGFNLDSIR